MNVLESVVKKGNNLYLKTAVDEVDISERKKKLGTEGCIWSEFEGNFLKDGEWISDGKYIRAGVSAAVFTPNFKSTILSRFDVGHPTAAGKLTPPAGLWDSTDDLKAVALKELGEEVIVTRKESFGFWCYNNGKVLEETWVKKYAKDNGLNLDDDLCLRIYDVELNREDVFNIYLNGKFQGNCLLAAEFETGSIEFIFLFKLRFLPVVTFKDGEFFKTWLHREVDLFKKEQIIDENLTTKAVKIISLLQ